MLLYYHKDPLGNFGDDLNPWLWHQLLPGAFTGEVAHDPAQRGEVSESETLFVGIGTLLNRNIPTLPRKLVFSTGAGYGAPPDLDERWQFFCVRGPVTRRMLGLEDSMAVTDGAALVRTIVAGARPDARGIGYMPHCSSARNADWSSICEDTGLAYIDPQRPVDEVLNALRSTEFLITEALHGAIVADALRIPWMPVTQGSPILDIKWHDWCQSLGLEYRPTKLPTLWRLGVHPGNGARLRLAAKTAIVRMVLRKLARRGRPMTSANGAIERATDGLLERLQRLRQHISQSR
jgi:succinoglycan biosynthesis protein ExoV